MGVAEIGPRKPHAGLHADHAVLHASLHATLGSRTRVWTWLYKAGIPLSTVRAWKKSFIYQDIDALSKGRPPNLRGSFGPISKHLSSCVDGSGPRPSARRRAGGVDVGRPDHEAGWGASKLRPRRPPTRPVLRPSNAPTHSPPVPKPSDLHRGILSAAAHPAPLNMPPPSLRRPRASMAAPPPAPRSGEVGEWTATPWTTRPVTAPKLRPFPATRPPRSSAPPSPCPVKSISISQSPAPAA